MPEKKESTDSLFTKFKQQCYSEHVNREFKGPIAVRPVFLHSPHRVEALIFLLLIALMAYFLLQRIYRQSLPKSATPKQRRTTAETILRAFNSSPLRADTVANHSNKTDEENRAGGKRLWQVQQLAVELGQHVQAGDPLCVLADHSELYIEGTAFEQDAQEIERAVREHADVAAVVESDASDAELVPGLHILYLADNVDAQSRAFHFYVQLPNTLADDSGDGDGPRFISWRFKPGQRLKLKVPVETWPKSIVLPVEAVVQDGPESFVFQRFGDHFDRRPARVEYRDPYSVVIANDGALKLGDVVAAAGAEQLRLALKNKSGGSVDPHAGHHH